MKPKLFNPSLMQKKPGNALEAREKPDCFCNGPVHADLPVLDNSTTSMGMGYGLKMTAKAQGYKPTPEHRAFVAKTKNGNYEY